MKEHLRPYGARELLDEASNALGGGDFTSARALLDTRRAEHASENDLMQRGFSVLLECKQCPSPESRSRGQPVYDSKAQSMVRRLIRRSCLEKVR